MIISLPIPCIWAMTMPARHKVAVSGIFLLGLLTLGASIAKLVIFDFIQKQSHDPDISYVFTPTVYWPMVESSLGIIGACLPLLRPLFSRGSGGSRGFGQVRNLRSVRLGSEAESAPEMKSRGYETESDGKNGSVSTIRRLVPSALVPLGEEHSLDEEITGRRENSRLGRADSNV